MTTEPTWRKSSRCANATCVEVALTPHGALVRDGKDRGGPRLAFDRLSWATFLDDIRAGNLDLTR